MKSNFRSPSAALADWYASHPVVRHLWAIEYTQGMRVIVTLEPAVDGNDVHPAWIANNRAWIHDLQSQLRGPVRLELIDGPSHTEAQVEDEGVVVADLCWRDPSEP
jgi:hypothetical protein